MVPSFQEPIPLVLQAPMVPSLFSLREPLHREPFEMNAFHLNGFSNGSRYLGTNEVFLLPTFKSSGKSISMIDPA